LEWAQKRGKELMKAIVAAQLEGLLEVALLFGGLALFFVAAGLAQRMGSFTLALAVLLGLCGFIAGACYSHWVFVGERTGPEHFLSEAGGAFFGIAIGAAAAVLVRLLIAIRQRLAGGLHMEQRSRVAEPNKEELPKELALATKRKPIVAESARGDPGKIFAPKRPTLLITHFAIQQFLRQKINRN
jgi:hypothetical protein